MPAEIVFPYPTTGLTTLTARLRTGATVVGSAIALSDSASAGIYLGDVPGGTADGNYDVVVYQASTVLGASARPLVWRSGAEVLPAIPGSAMTLTPAERTASAAVTEAAIISDADGQAVKAALVAAIGNTNVNEVALAAATAAAVRVELATELARMDAAISTRESESSAATRAATDQTEHDATQVALAAIAAIGDPLTKPVPGTYPAGSAGEALGKLVVGPPDEPAVVIPGAPADTGLCRVYAYLEGINNDKRLPTARIEFRLIAPDGTKAVASERLIGERVTTLKVDGLGRLQGEDGQPWADFQRNDMLTPSGTTYEVTSAALGISRKVVTLTTQVADLRALLLA
jgi:hypothetical protein